MISESKKQPAANGALVLSAFILFVATVLGTPLAMVWAANSMGGF